MGDLQSEEERDIVLEVQMPALPEAVDEFLVAKAQLSYFNIITSRMDTVECQLTANRALTGKCTVAFKACTVLMCAMFDCR